MIISQFLENFGTGIRKKILYIFFIYIYQMKH